MRFGPIFNKEEFLLPLLKLQQDIEKLETADGKRLVDICHQPLSQSPVCNIQSIWAYWQDSESLLNEVVNDTMLDTTYNFLDHFLSCTA